MSRAIEVYNAIVQENGTVASVASAIAEGTSYSFAMSPIINYQPALNAFIDTLVQKIIQIPVTTGIYKHVFVGHKKEGNPLGWDYEVKYVNPAKSREYNLALGNTLLDTKEPDVKVEYFRVNRMSQYWVTIPRALLMGGWTEWSQLDDFIDSTIQSLTNGNAIDEQEIFKRTIVDTYNKGLIPTKEVDMSDLDNLTETLLSTADLLPFASINSNRWLQYAVESGRTDETPATTWANFEDVEIIMPVSYYTKAKMKLAGAFNLSLVDFRKKVTLIDDFAFNYSDENGSYNGSANGLVALIVHKDMFQYRDKLNMSESFHNAANMSNNIYLNVWQTYIHNILKCGIAIVDKAVASFLTPSTLSAKVGDTVTLTVHDYKSGSCRYHAKINGTWTEGTAGSVTPSTGYVIPEGATEVFFEALSGTDNDNIIYSDVVTVIE